VFSCSYDIAFCTANELTLVMVCQIIPLPFLEPHPQAEATEPMKPGMAKQQQSALGKKGFWATLFRG
jgi:hypothetical protein